MTPTLIREVLEIAGRKLGATPEQAALIARLAPEVADMVRRLAEGESIRVLRAEGPRPEAALQRVDREVDGEG